MATVRARVLRTAGTNCDVETRFALELAGAEADLVHVNHLAQETDPFAGCQILALPGGFTYGDDVAAGKVLAVELAHVLGEKLQAFVDRGGLVIGICNGFQVLVKTGLLPDARIGVGKQRVTLTNNDSHKFEARWVTMRAPENTKCIFVEPGEQIEVPAAHGEGKFVCESPAVLDELTANGQIAYQYVTRDGEAPAYPADPNGSTAHIAGICDPSGRIFGLMPHPERHLYAYHHPRWTREGRSGDGEGLRIFKRAVAYAAQA